MGSDESRLPYLDCGTHHVCVHLPFHQSGLSTLDPIILRYLTLTDAGTGWSVSYPPPKHKAHRRARYHGRRRPQDRLLCRSYRRRANVHRDAPIPIFCEQESLFFVTQALTTWQWSRLSDFVGRRPVILIGLLGLSVSNFAFGLSRTLTTLIIR